MMCCVSMQEAKDVKVLDVKMFNSYKGTGIAVLTATFRIFITNSIDDIRLKRLAEVPGRQFTECLLPTVLMIYDSKD